MRDIWESERMAERGYLWFCVRLDDCEVSGFHSHRDRGYGEDVGINVEMESHGV